MEDNCMRESVWLTFPCSQAPVHTDSLTIYETEVKIIPTTEGEDAEIRRPFVRAKAVVEQRVSHFLMGLALIGTMTSPLLAVLHTMPLAVFAGVFFVVGVSHSRTPVLSTLPTLVIYVAGANKLTTFFMFLSSTKSGAQSNPTASYKSSSTSSQSDASSSTTTRCSLSPDARSTCTSASSSRMWRPASPYPTPSRQSASPCSSCS